MAEPLSCGRCLSIGLMAASKTDEVTCACGMRYTGEQVLAAPRLDGIVMLPPPTASVLNDHRDRTDAKFRRAQERYGEFARQIAAKVDAIVDHIIENKDREHPLFKLGATHALIGSPNPGPAGAAYGFGLDPGTPEPATLTVFAVDTAAGTIHLAADSAVPHGQIETRQWKCSDPTCACHRPPTVDPLDVEIDGVKLRVLLEWDEIGRREARHFSWDEGNFTPAQRAAVSAHWSAQLRAKVEASRKDDAAAAISVYVDGDIE